MSTPDGCLALCIRCPSLAWNHIFPLLCFQPFTPQLPPFSLPKLLHSPCQLQSERGQFHHSASLGFACGSSPSPSSTYPQTHTHTHTIQVAELVVPAQLHGHLFNYNSTIKPLMYSELQRGQQTTVCKNSILTEKTDTYVYNLYKLI